MLTREWQKSSKSADSPQCCVLVAQTVDGVKVMDSKDPHGPELYFSPDEWAAFLAGVKDEEFERDGALSFA